MKKLSFIKSSALAAVFMAGILAGCSGKSAEAKIIQNDDGSISITKIDEDGKAVAYNKKYDGFENVTIVKLGLTSGNNPIKINLNDYADKDVLMELSCDMKVVDSSGEAEHEIIWLVNEVDENFPQIYRDYIKSDEWTKVSGQAIIHIGKNRQFYLSGAGLTKENITVYLKNFRLKLSGEGIGSQEVVEKKWTEVPSLKETYKDYFDYFGLAVTKEDLDSSKVQDGLKYQASSTTMGNEFKPDFLFNWTQPTKFEDFTAENGKTYKVPYWLPGFNRMDACLKECKELGLKMRGHVLVWHSQTPWWFFVEDYGEGDYYVDVDEMNARMEWYIKTVMEHVAEWEKKNNNGEHIVTIWDVVNEVCSDGATESSWLRGEESSEWMKVYENGDYIVNAFRYANKYAPADVELVYNDYGCSSPHKLKGILKIIDSIQAAPDARIDAMGMQSHVNMKTPVTGPNSFESAVQAFVNKGLNVQITELDIANGQDAYSSIRLKAKYNEFFKMFIANRKTAEHKGIEGVTIWGLNDEGTWLNSQKEHQGNTQYPLLFKTRDFIVKPAFYGVLEAAEN
ncbi:MAG: endo-1,4-beta-xylanase [Treponema sp.]|nr:endo-1,4-beta-xylanase [Treponema sp.]